MGSAKWVIYTFPPPISSLSSSTLDKSHSLDSRSSVEPSSLYSDAISSRHVTLKQTVLSQLTALHLHSSPARARPVAQVGKQVEKDPFKMQILLGFFNMGLAKKFVRVFSIPSHRRAHKLFGQPNNIIYRLSSTEQTMCPRNLSSLFNSEWEKMLLGKKVIKG